jgi:hypothetical protein
VGLGVHWVRGEEMRCTELETQRLGGEQLPVVFKILIKQEVKTPKTHTASREEKVTPVNSLKWPQGLLYPEPAVTPFLQLSSKQTTCFSQVLSLG